MVSRSFPFLDDNVHAIFKREDDGLSTLAAKLKMAIRVAP